MLKRWTGVLVVGALGLTGRTAEAQTPPTRYILHATADELDAIVARHALTVTDVLRRSTDEIVVVDQPVDRTAADIEAELGGDADVLGFEPDRRVDVSERPSATGLTQSTAAILEALKSTWPVSYFGSTVPASYASQAAWTILKLDQSQALATGNSVVAVIDTGVDADHPALKDVVTGGYDFTRNTEGPATDMADLSQSTAAILEQSTAAILEQRNVILLNQSTAAILEQSTAAILESLPAAFGHGTMVAGLIHYVAPTARIMPLKAFHADGSSQLSDILRAVYYAVDHGARVINMSFSTPDSSRELQRAIDYAYRNKVIVVAAAGNEGLQARMFPAGFSSVIPVGSVDNGDLRSGFSNYGGASGVRIALPGESLVTTYPAGHYAAVSGTSFSAGLTSGAVALMLQVFPKLVVSDVNNDIITNAKPVAGFGNGRIDLPAAITKSSKRR